ncbi:MAG TPA: hypothetical protein VMT82_01570 [candidate division Zixibacteria bacterium]|nr:hypothetical protein [candidate division Zixibacteria bacterium]
MTTRNRELGPWLLGAATVLIFFLGCILFLSGVPVAAQEGELRNEPPKDMTVDQIIQRFAAKEKEFKLARESYTWRQDVRVQTLDGNTVDGEYRNVFDVVFDDKGRRTEQIVFAPQNTLQRIEMTREDLDDIENRMPFTMTTDELPEYDVAYLGQQKEDELNTYVFDLKPKKIEKGKRYFEGRIWVDDHDLQIVKTYGKNVPDLINGKPVNEMNEKKRKNAEQENLFPKFTTWREQIDGRYWFPTYTKVDDVLHFSDLRTGDVHIRQVIKYTNYKRFGSKSRITFEGQEISTKPGEKPQQQPK